MSKRRGSRQHQQEAYSSSQETFHHVTPHQAKELRALTPCQQRHLRALKTQTCVFAIGCAGTGKTFLSAAHAASEFVSGQVEQLILMRPAVEAGENLGFLKGTLEEKFLPYLAPYVGVFRERMGRGFYESALKHEAIQPVPIAYAQGLTFKNCIVLLDEAENTDPKQMRLILSRMGENARIFISGDLNQQYSKGRSGLLDAMNRIKHVPGVAIVEYDLADVVRSDFARRVLECYEN